MGLYYIFLAIDDPWLVWEEINVIVYDGKRTSQRTRDRSSTDFSNMMDCGFF